MDKIDLEHVRKLANIEIIDTPVVFKLIQGVTYVMQSGDETKQLHSFRLWEKKPLPGMKVKLTNPYDKDEFRLRLLKPLSALAYQNPDKIFYFGETIYDGYWAWATHLQLDANSILARFSDTYENALTALDKRLQDEISEIRERYAGVQQGNDYWLQTEMTAINQKHALRLRELDRLRGDGNFDTD